MLATHIQQLPQWLVQPYVEQYFAVRVPSLTTLLCVELQYNYDNNCVLTAKVSVKCCYYYYYYLLIIYEIIFL